MLIELLERLFSRPGDSSRQAVKNRLKLVLAHDRTDLPPQTMEALRQEILAVVSRYVELDTASTEFSLSSSDRSTALVANLPIRRIHNQSEVPTCTPDLAVMDSLDLNVELLELEPMSVGPLAVDQPEVPAANRPEAAPPEAAAPATPTHDAE